MKNKLREIDFQYEIVSGHSGGKEGVLEVSKDDSGVHRGIVFTAPMGHEFLTSLAYGKMQFYDKRYGKVGPIAYVGLSACCNGHVVALSPGKGSNLIMRDIAAPAMNVCAILPVVRKSKVKVEDPDWDPLENRLIEPNGPIVVTGDGCSNQDKNLALVDFYHHDIRYIGGCIPKSSGRHHREERDDPRQIVERTEYPVYGFGIDKGAGKIFTKYDSGERGIDITIQLEAAGVDIPKTIELSDCFERIDHCDKKELSNKRKKK